MEAKNINDITLHNIKCMYNITYNVVFMICIYMYRRGTFEKFCNLMCYNENSQCDKHTICLSVITKICTDRLSVNSD